MASVMKERGIKSRERSELSVVFAARRRSFSEGLNALPRNNFLSTRMSIDLHLNFDKYLKTQIELLCH